MTKRRYKATAHACMMTIGLVLFFGVLGIANPLDGMIAIIVLGGVGGASSGYANYE